MNPKGKNLIILSILFYLPYLTIVAQFRNFTYGADWAHENHSCYNYNKFKEYEESYKWNKRFGNLKKEEVKNKVFALAWENTQKLIRNSSNTFGVTYLLGLYENACKDSSKTYICRDYDDFNWRRVWNHLFSTDTGEPSWFTETFFSMKLVENGTTHTFYAKNYLDSRIYNKFTGHESFNILTGQEEIFNFKIEIYLDVLIESGFYRKAITDREKKVWVHDIVEALTIIMLNQIGYIEFFLFNHAKGSSMKNISLFEKYPSNSEINNFADYFVNLVLNTQK